MPPSDPPSGNASGTIAMPSDAYSSGVLVTSRRSSVTAVTTSTTRSMIRRPPSSMSALGRPPMRVLLPPAWITPVIVTASPASQQHRSGAQDARGPARAVGDGGAGTSCGRAAVEDHVDMASERIAYRRRGGGWRRAARIRARRRDRPSGSTDERARDRVPGHANAHGPRPRRERHRHLSARSDDQRERSRPVPGHQVARPVGQLGGEGLGHGDRVDEDEERLGLWPPLGAEDARDAPRLESIRAEAVEALRWKHHEAAGAEDRPGLLYRARSGPRRVDDDHAGHRSSARRPMSRRKCMPSNVMRLMAAYAWAIAAAASAPSAWTPSTRPPAVTRAPPFVAVPA